MKIDRVMLDPGHGGIGPNGYTTPGKRYTFVGGGGVADLTIYEGDRMRRLAELLAGELLARGLRVFSSLDGMEILSSMWTPTYEDVPLVRRVANANVLDPTGLLFLSLHSNAISKDSTGQGQHKARGISIYTSGGQTASDPIATAIHRSLSALGLMPMRSQSHEDGDPDYEECFYVLRQTRCRAALLELGFHDSPYDVRHLLDDADLADFASSTADALADFGAMA